MTVEKIAALTIAGSDSGGGAGIQADLKTFSALGVFGTTVVTAVTAQNLQGVGAIQSVRTMVVNQQLLAVLEGFPVKAIKTGMLFSASVIATVADVLERTGKIPLVVDPVFVSTAGNRLVTVGAIKAMQVRLFPLAALVTPNLAECEKLTGLAVGNASDMEKAAERFFRRFGVAVLVKGGHLEGGQALDLFFDGHGPIPFSSPRVSDINTHGSGCTLAAAITAHLARGLAMREAITAAKSYITGAMQNSLLLGDGVRVLNHFWKINKT